MLNRLIHALLVLPLLAFGQDQPELTVDQIVQKHVDALGGLDKLKAITTLSATGKAISQGGQMETPMFMRMKRPSSMRMEITVQGKKIVQAFDGTTAWMINPMMGSDTPQKASPEDTQDLKDSADIDFSSLANYKEKGSTVELVGMEDVDGTPSYNLKVTKKSGRVEHQYLNSKTFLPIKTTTKRKQMGSELDIDAYPTNFKPVNGVLFPFTVDQKVGGKSMIQIALDKVDANQPIDDAVFQFPEKPKAAGKPEPKP